MTTDPTRPLKLFEEDAPKLSQEKHVTELAGPDDRWLSCSRCWCDFSVVFWI